MITDRDDDASVRVKEGRMVMGPAVREGRSTVVPVVLVLVLLLLLL